MSAVSFVKKAISHPDKVIYNLGRRGLLNWMSDEAYIKLRYYAVFGRMPDLKNPKTFNEKLQWLKLHDRKPIYSTMVDKYEAKKYVASIIGDKYIIPTLGLWEKFDDIDFDSLPEQFVLKCTHDSGGLAICKDKSTFDRQKAKKKIEESLKQKFFYFGREWPYKDVKPRIIAEKYMEDKETGELSDYKFFTFDGEAKALFIATERQVVGEDVKFDFYDMDFKHLDFRQGHENAKIYPKKPKTFEAMKELAEKLSKGIPHVRVDFYEVNGETYFGELTFAHFSGFVPFNPSEWDTTFGEWLKIPNGGGTF